VKRLQAVRGKAKTVAVDAFSAGNGAEAAYQKVLTGTQADRENIYRTDIPIYKNGENEWISPKKLMGLAFAALNAGQDSKKAAETLESAANAQVHRAQVVEATANLERLTAIAEKKATEARKALKRSV
jgi:hypothetical protein